MIARHGDFVFTVYWIKVEEYCMHVCHTQIIKSDYGTPTQPHMKQVSQGVLGPRKTHLN